MHALAALGFPAWLRAAHWINVFFIGFLVRSGIQILMAYPRLYLNDNCIPGSEWLTVGAKRIPRGRPWTTLEQEVSVSPWIAQPGGKGLGLGRHWHFVAATFWLLNGVVYVALLFATGEWQRLIPTSWSIFPDAWRTFLTYASFHSPPASAFHPYDPLQQLTYAAVVFLLGPFLIVTAAAQSPAIEAQLPWYPRLFGGRQVARSLHFLGLLAVIAFTVLHTALVLITGAGRNLGDIILGQHTSDTGLAIALGVALIAVILAIYALTTILSRRRPRFIQVALGSFLSLWMTPLSRRTVSRQELPAAAISPELLVNGDPPASAEYLTALWRDFAGYTLRVEGLVEQPLECSLAELAALPRQTQITRHNCIQGWTGIAAWTGVRVGDLLARVQPKPDAKYVVFWSYSCDHAGQPFYETLSLEQARHPQTILAYAMNGRPLPMEHGAPLRLRVETQLGFKMVKWVRRIELVERYSDLRGGQGGSREDNMYYEHVAGM